jgi:tetratricopeptide (TPR) repeat protein
VQAGRVLGAIVVTVGAVTVALAKPQGDEYFDLGEHRRAVTTASADAAQWFVRGLMQTYGFNHEEAVRCYERALQADPDLAMAYWGIAYALGPNINNMEMDEAAQKRAPEAVAAAAARAGKASPVEQALIAALGKRYAQPAPEDRTPLDRAYADAMRGVYKTYPDDPDVAALFAEALMDLRPWKLWTKDGKPAPETPEIVSLLEKSLARWPQHPALCHLYIHTMEASPHPEKAEAAADRLRNLVPDAGHLVHMPSHIYVLVGRYNEVVTTNQKGIEVDNKFVAREGRINFYTLYRLHNFHFVVFGAMFDGRQEVAMQAARDIVAELPAELLEQWPDFVEAFVPTTFHVMVRFGQWQQILDAPEPPESQPYSRAIRHYARTVALAALGQVEAAESEHEKLVAAAANVPETRMLFQNTCKDILQVALAMAEGEVEYRKGNAKAAFSHLRQAVELDDNLNYDEPWGWMQPARHALGALLLEQGELQQAESVYRADLERHPKNGWALHGLAEALRRQGKEKDAAQCEAQLSESWQRSDVKLTASCFCRTGKMAKR